MKDVFSERCLEYCEPSRLEIDVPQRKLFERVKEILGDCIQRNKMIAKVTTLSFFTVVLLSILLTVLVFTMAPWLSDWFWSMARSERRYVAIPPPFTENLFYFILLNNVGHFWNPPRMLVWVPLFGTFFLGLELMLNAAMIGMVTTVAGMTHGVLYPIVGLVPHGVVEIPAFILQFASLIRWHVTIIEAVMVKIVGEKVDYAKLKQGIKDAVILAMVSVILFVIAAFIETYITPQLLGLG